MLDQGTYKEIELRYLATLETTTKSLGSEHRYTQYHRRFGYFLSWSSKLRKCGIALPDDPGDQKEDSGARTSGHCIKFEQSWWTWVRREVVLMSVLAA